MKKVTLGFGVSFGLVGMFLLAACGGGSSGSDPEPFNTSCFPLTIPGPTTGSGNISFDGDGNLLVPNSVTNEVLSVDRLTCTLSTLAAVPAPFELLSVVYHPDADTIYVGGEGGNIFAVNPSSGASTHHVHIGNYINALVVAPAGYGPFGGQLLAALSGGILVAVDTASTATTDVADTGGTLSDIEFAGDGTLYGVNDDPGEIITISAAGITSVFATGFDALDGIAFDDTKNRLLVSDSDDDLLYGVQLSDGARTVLGSFDFDSGSSTAGLAFDGETLFMMTGESSLILEAFIP